MRTVNVPDPVSALAGLEPRQMAVVLVDFRNDFCRQALRTRSRSPANRSERRGGQKSGRVREKPENDPDGRATITVFDNGGSLLLTRRIACAGTWRNMTISAEIQPRVS
jgi:hypothetical protein